MRFRPCIDVHNGQVKQIIGGSLKDQGDSARENFVSRQDGAYYGALYRDRGLSGGHVILLNHRDSPYYEAGRRQVMSALGAFPGGLQAGGGITPENAADYLDAGASHVIVTSYVFAEGRLDEHRLEKLSGEVGKDRLVLDVSCRKKDGVYYVVTDRWQTFTRTAVNADTLDYLAAYSDELLVHGVDVEGRQQGIETELVSLLGSWGKCPVTYAGGISAMEDIAQLNVLGQGRLDFTVGSALDLFGGTLPFDRLCEAFGGGEARRQG